MKKNLLTYATEDVELLQGALANILSTYKVHPSTLLLNYDRLSLIEETLSDRSVVYNIELHNKSKAQPTEPNNTRLWSHHCVNECAQLVYDTVFQFLDQFQDGPEAELCGRIARRASGIVESDTVRFDQELDLLPITIHPPESW